MSLVKSPKLVMTPPAPAITNDPWMRQAPPLVYFASIWLVAIPNVVRPMPVMISVVLLGLEVSRFHIFLASGWSTAKSRLNLVNHNPSVHDHIVLGIILNVLSVELHNSYLRFRIVKDLTARSFR
jgi:hypothetical protein